jgi:hypothetical protein
MAPAPEKTDHAQLLRHFQSMNASNVTAAISILLTLSTATAAFGVNIIMSAKNPIGTRDVIILLTGVFCLLLSILSGILLILNRINDVRLTIEGIVMMRDNPQLITDPKEIAQVNEFKDKADRTNRLSTRLLKCQAWLFGAGFAVTTAAVLLTHWETLGLS